jgi:uncharacterized membrane protein HdeD (DUF308 family)
MNAGLFPHLARNWWVFVLYGAIAVVFGLFAIARPLAAAIALAWAFGVMALAEAVATVFALFHRHVAVPRGWLAVYALASLVFGLLAVFDPVAVASALLMLLAAWLVVGGVYRIVFALRVRKVIEGEWLVALSGALAIVLGLLFVLSPLAGLAVTALWIGVIAVFYGVLQIAAGLRLRRLGAAP